MKPKARMWRGSLMYSNRVGKVIITRCETETRRDSPKINENKERGLNSRKLIAILALTFVMFTLQGCEHSQKVNIPDNTIIYKNQTYYNQTVEDYMKLGKGSYYLRNKAVLRK
jgi:hypothetical protein